MTLEQSAVSVAAVLKWFLSDGEISSAQSGLVRFAVPSETVALPSTAPAGITTCQRPLLSEPPRLPTRLSVRTISPTRVFRIPPRRLAGCADRATAGAAAVCTGFGLVGSWLQP